MRCSVFQPLNCHPPVPSLRPLRWSYFPSFLSFRGGGCCWLFLLPRWMAGGGSRWAWESAASGSFFKGKGRCARFLSCHRMTWLYLDYLCKDPVSKYGCVLKCWGLGLQGVNLLGNTVQSVTQAKLVNHPLWAPGRTDPVLRELSPFLSPSPMSLRDLSPITASSPALAPQVSNERNSPHVSELWCQSLRTTCDTSKLN